MNKKIKKGGLIILGAIVFAILFPNQETQLEHKVLINAPKKTVYETLLKIDNVDEWVSAVVHSEYISTVKNGPGAVRQCKLEDGSMVQEKLTETLENEWIKMEMTQHDLPVDFFKWKIETTDQDHQTQVKQTTQYKVKFGLIGVLLNHFVVKSSLDQTLTGAYLGLKKYVEDK